MTEWKGGSKKNECGGRKWKKTTEGKEEKKGKEALRYLYILTYYEWIEIIINNSVFLLATINS